MYSVVFVTINRIKTKMLHFILILKIYLNIYYIFLYMIIKEVFYLKNNHTIIKTVVVYLYASPYNVCIFKSLGFKRSKVFK